MMMSDDYDASKLVDGQLDSYAMTSYDEQKEHYFTVDLEQEHDIKRIEFIDIQATDNQLSPWIAEGQNNRIPNCIFHRLPVLDISPDCHGGWGNCRPQI